MIEWKASKGLIDEIMPIFQQMIKKDVEPNVVILSNMLNIFKGNDTIIQKMLKYFDQYGVIKNAFTYSALFNHYAAAGKSNEEGVKLWNEMKEENIAVNFQVFAAIKNFFTKTGNTALIEKIEKEDLKRKRDPMERKYGFLKRITNNLNRIIKERRYQDAEQYFRDIKYPDMYVYNAVVKLYKEMDDESKLKALLDEIALKKMKYTQGFYQALMNFYGSKGNVDEVMRLFKEMLDKGFKPDIHTLVTLLQIFRGDESMIQRILAYYTESGFSKNSPTYIALFRHYTTVGKSSAEGKKLLEEMRGDVEPRFVLYESIARFFKSAQDNEAMQSIIQEARTNGFGIDVQKL